MYYNNISLAPLIFFLFVILLNVHCCVFIIIRFTLNSTARVRVKLNQDQLLMHRV